MVVICLADVADRFHGFLRSVMLNPHPGVYLAMDLDAGSRRRVWAILEGWWQAEPRGMGLMLWRDPAAPMGVSIANFGAPKRTLVDFQDQWALLWKTEADSSLTTDAAPAQDPPQTGASDGIDSPAT